MATVREQCPEPDPVTRPWAKHTKNGEHALVCHAIDTMEVAYLLYPIILGPRIRRELDRAFEPLQAQAQDWVALFCGLHDLGKFTPAFQALVIDVAKKRFTEEDHEILDRNAPTKARRRWDTKHGLGTAAHMEDMLKAAGASHDTAQLIGHVLGGHHGWFPGPGVIRGIKKKDDLGNQSWARRRSDLVRAVAALRGLDFETPNWSRVEMPSLALLGLAGLTTISDWVASDSSRFDYEPWPTDLLTYRDHARKQAEQALERTWWTAWQLPTCTGYRDLFRKSPPRPLQQAVEKVLNQCAEPGVLVVEAPTGEGKTRAGLQAAADLSRRLGLGGLYLATPTKALSKQAADDVRELMRATNSPLDVNLVYSGAAAELRAGRQEDQIRPTAVGEHEHSGDEDGQDSLEWFTRKRGLAFPVGVGTIDQLVKSVIRSGHNYLGMTSVSNKVVIVDEAHAYDLYTGLLVDQFLWFCGWVGVPVVLMSATLPANRREELLEYWHAGAEGRAPDPERTRVVEPGSWQVTWSGAQRSAQSFDLSDETRGRGPVRVEHVSDSPAAIAARVVERVGAVGTAIVVLNTRVRAQDVHDRIADLLESATRRPELVLFTGESQGVARTEVEARVRMLLGKGSPEDRHAIVVGTQVLEHGLDIDADLMVSDLCPVDLLFQRAGRLHRHARHNRPPGVKTPLLLIADTDPAEREARRPSARTSLGFSTGTSSIYLPWILGRTRAVLTDVLSRGTWDPLDEIGKQVHRVYVEDDPLIEPGWERAWEAAELGYERRRQWLRFQASAVMASLVTTPRSLLRLTRHSGPGGQTRPRDGRERDAK
ncbi:CRISPR-associated helicase Cas3' [Nocardiopsis aegyptia]|uniref:CRISPR-associated endonuclease/helicase Cas3 n=1 Tax=Nocardiopsis aegyptia TaxID=220378 RepID=A0A7Z0EIP3_9ACTN|nr:CRISPR-associated helicase Cas3' [Nocardiopsis aegyptia]NYJ32804.1 CRISPR-associated endonuclease/helicase Cas3 [Nocardiopsis aegyptia]